MYLCMRQKSRAVFHNCSALKLRLNIAFPKGQWWIAVLGSRCPMCVMQPCMVFAGEQFENDADFKLAKSILLDMFRGRVVEKINLKVQTLVN